MRHIFKLHPHTHTGKLLHHRHTSYRGLFVIAILAGGVMLATVNLASASDLAVSATVPATIPNDAPAFTQPDDYFETDTASVDFAGTCPVVTPAVLIVLRDGTETIGSGQCSPSGTFFITATIRAGERQIVAQIRTVTDGVGQSSPPLHVSYNPPAPAPGPTETPIQQRPPAASPNAEPAAPSVYSPLNQSGAYPLIIVAEREYITFGSNMPVTWTGSIEGGKAPYRITIEWGDGVSETKTAEGSGNNTFSHIYKDDTTYTIRVTATDAAGASLSRSYAAVSMRPPTLASRRDVSSTASYLSEDTITLYIVAAYTGVVGLIVLLWHYEHVYFRRAVAIPLHYSWQDKLGGKKRH